jgi:hypothetical protein
VSSERKPNGFRVDKEEPWQNPDKDGCEFRIGNDDRFGGRQDMADQVGELVMAAARFSVAGRGVTLIG